MGRSRRVRVSIGSVVLLLLSVVTVMPAWAEPVLVSELGFDPAAPTHDPHGSGTTIQGGVDVTAGGWLDFHGRAVVETPHRPSLNPGTADFSFGARVALTRGVGDWNVMQKGFYDDRQWKLSIHPRPDGGQLSCRVGGTAGVVHVFSSGAVLPDDGSWHQVECARVGEQVELRVDGVVRAVGSGPIGDVGSSESYLIGSKGIASMPDPDQYLGLLDDAFVLVDVPGDPGGGGSPPPLAEAAVATVETDPVLHAGDAADDPAIWRHPSDPGQSLIIGNDKGGALDVYDLQGRLLQRIEEGFFGNVDVRTGMSTASLTRDVAAVYRAGLRIYAVDPHTRQLSNITDAGTGSIAVPTGGEGLCLYRSATSGDLFAFVISRAGTVAQFRLGDLDGDDLVDAEQVRVWALGSEAEGCVADDTRGLLYVAEEDVALWRYGAEPSDGTASADRVAVDRVTAAGGRLAADIEGVTLVEGAAGAGYLIVSAQAESDTANYLAVYDRTGDNAHVRDLAVVSGPDTDGCGRTDGIAALAADLGPAFPQGLFVCQDNTNTTPGNAGNQNFKLVPLEQVVPLEGGEPPANRAPTAQLALPLCTGLACSLDASGSADPDGDQLTWAWDLGDGATATGPSTEHTFPGSGSWTVTVTVTDPAGLSDTAQRVVQVDEGVASIAFRGAAGASANWTSVAPVIPAAAQPGDAALLVVTANQAGAVLQAPPGWQDLGIEVDETMQSRVWVRALEAGDPGTAVTVASSTITKMAAQVAVYAGTDPDDPVAAAQSANETGSGAAHTTPVVGASASSWGVFAWANKTPSTTGWTAPAGVTERLYTATGGSGRVTSLLADTGGAVGGPTTGGYTATASQGGTKATTWTIVLNPAVSDGGTAGPLTAVAEAACEDLTCTFDGSRSSGGAGGIADWSWSFDDGGSASGANVQRTLTAEGQIEATLTVTDGGGAQATGTVTARASVVPTAAFTATCTDLACRFDGSGSTDTTGPVIDWAWEFGDGATGSGAVVDHDYAVAGGYPVALTVTDDDGQTAMFSTEVTVGEPAAPAIDLVGVSGTNANRQSHTVTVPSGTGAGDGMLLFVTTNRVGVLPEAPVGPGGGWVELDTVTAGSTQTRVWQRVAGHGDASATVTIPLTGFAKTDALLMVYSGTSGTAPVGAFAGAAETATTAQHTTPTVTSSVPGAWVVSYWSDKTSGTTAWTAPAGQTLRYENYGSGGGRISTLVADSGPVPPGIQGGLTAVADSANAKATMWTVVLAPRG